MRFLRTSLAFICLFSLFAVSASAAPAADSSDITSQCNFTANENEKNVSALRDDKWYAGWKADSVSGTLEIALPADSNASGLFLSWISLPGAWVLEADQGGGYASIFTNAADSVLYHQYVSLPQGCRSLRVRNASGAQTPLQIGAVRIYEGTVGEDVQQWQEPCEKADILLFVAHPDDDQLYFGGMVPTYAAERGKTVQVVFMTAPNRQRVSEALNGQWLVGNRYSPVFGPFPDKKTMSIAENEKVWDREELNAFLVANIRRFQPDVILTQDFEGEYGHGAHRMMVDAVSKMLEPAADASQYPDSAQRYGVWNTPKCYMHLYQTNPIQMDWSQPLSSMGGKTGLELARAGFREHVSQQGFGMDVREGGSTSCLRFGLYRTLVGEDVAKNDFLENITPEAVRSLNPQAYPTPTPEPTATPALTPQSTPEPTRSPASPYLAYGICGGIVGIAILIFALAMRKKR